MGCYVILSFWIKKYNFDYLIFSIISYLETIFMNNYVLSTCSTCDLPKEYLKKRDIKFVCFHFSIDGKNYNDDLGQTMPYDKFYDTIVKSSDSKTSQVNVREFLDYFTPILEEGKDILHISMSTGISGVYNSAKIAAAELSEKFPNRKILVVDSLAASSGLGLIMATLADMRDEGKAIDELYDWIELNKRKMHHWFFASDLSFYIRGGRISKAAGFFGTVLKICPVLHVDSHGKLAPVTKVRTKKKAILEMLNRMIQNVKDGLNYSGKCFISHSKCFDDARQLADLIEEKFKSLSAPVLINYVGTTIGCHTGPGTVALFFWG